MNPAKRLRVHSPTSFAHTGISPVHSISATASLRTITPLASLSTRQLHNMTAQVSHEIARVQRPAPAWTATAVVDGQFKDLSLSDYKGRFLVMVFYPLDFTFVCPTELIAFSDRIEEFNKLGADVVGISVDSEYSHLAWNNSPRKEGGLGGLKIPLVSDIKKEISRKYDVLVEDNSVALRGLFIIDPKGTLRIMHVNDLPIGRNVDEAIRLVEAIKFTDEHGEVCPINWNKGSKTMNPDPTGSKAYFESTY
ncbi:thioredoxin-like protein [Syncephalis fuscata]|nr:thioredoxin-like protein [Syncephalis fuscata]